MRHLAQLCMIIIISVLSVYSEFSEISELSELLETDTNGTLLSHMELAAYHGYDVSPDGIVTIDGDRYEIWPEVRVIG